MINNKDGALWWASGIDNSGLKKDGEEAAQILTKVGQQALKEQQLWIKELQNSMAKLNNELKTANFGRRPEMQADLARMGKDLTAAKDKLLSMQQQNLSYAQQEQQSQGGIIAGLGKWAVGIMSVTAAMEVGKKIIESTTATAHAFEFAMGAANEGLSYLWRTLATMDFTNFLSNMGDAVIMGYKVAQAMHEVKEMTRAESMTESDYKKRNAELEVLLRNKNLSPEDRKAYGKERISNEDFLAELRTKTAQKELATATSIAAMRAHIDDKLTDKLVGNASEITKAKAEELVKAREMVFNSQNPKWGGSFTAEDLQKSNDVIKTATKDVEDYANILEKYGSLRGKVFADWVSGTNESTKLQAEEYNNIRKKMYSNKPLFISEDTFLSNAEAAPNLLFNKRVLDYKEKLKEFPKEVQVMADAMRGYGDVTEKMIDNVVAAYNREGAARASGIEGTKRIRTTFENIDVQIASERERAAEKAAKKEGDMIELDSKIGQKKIDNLIKLKELEVKAMTDGDAKLRAQADVDYDRTIADMDKRKAQTLKDLNKDIGGTDEHGRPVAGKYVTDVLQSDQDVFDAEKIQAERVRQTKYTEINQDSADKIKKIWAEVTDYRLSGMDKEIAQARAKYQKLWNDALKVDSPGLLEEIAKEEGRVINQIKSKYAIQAIEDQLNITVKTNQVDGMTTGAAAQQNFVDQQEAQAKIVQQLKLAGDAESLRQAKILEENMLLDKQIFKQQKIRQIIVSAIQAGSASLGMLKDTGNLDEETYQGAMTMMQGFGKFVSGDFLGGAMDMLKQPIEALLSLGKSTGPTEKDFSKAISRMQKSLESLNTTISLSFGTDKLINFNKEILNIAINVHTGTMQINEMIDKWNKNTAGGFSTPLNQQLAHLPDISNITGYTLGKGWTTGNMTINEMNTNLAILQNGLMALNTIMDQYPNMGMTGMQQTVDSLQQQVTQLQQVKQQYMEMVTGTTADGIAQSIIDGFNAGQDGAVQFADNFEQLMRNAIMQSIKTSMLDKPLQAWYAEFVTALEPQKGEVTGKLTKAEIDSLKAEYNAIVQRANVALDAANQIAGLDAIKSNVSSITGDIGRAITEDTATWMAGLWNRMSLDLRAELDTAVTALGVTRQIEINTRLLGENVLVLIQTVKDGRTPGTTPRDIGG